jgi:hypothetical protein
MKRYYKAPLFIKSLSTSPLTLLLLLPALGLSFFALDSNVAESQEPERSVEMGTVDWNRNLDSAIKLSSQTGKPLFVLFQEIPG